MNILKPFRIIYIKTTNLTNGYHDNYKKLISFYKRWSIVYDFSVKLDPAYHSQLKNMISMVVKPGDTVLDIGCGTGLGTIYSSHIASKVTGIDISKDMVAILRQKIKREKINNIELVTGKFPDSISDQFDVIISSFAIVHFSTGSRPLIYEKIYESLKPGGKIGLFSAQGEIAKAFEMKDELIVNLKHCGFKNILLQDVSDIYRITTATK